ncbi:MAG TPA: outer membrane protein assembly factor BamE [Burkholderiaceae bacterium]|nr:outer membrane protein assembly factor BamE [Burkholderiaceae bacterium]
MPHEYHTASMSNDRCPEPSQAPRRLLSVLAAATMLAGCQTLSDVGSAAASWGPTFLGPYRPDVHQGNIITKEMVDQLRIGMTREQVRFMLGTPLMTSEFRKDRVDYIYYLNPRRGPVQNRRLTLYFQDNRLDKFNADPMPGEDEADTLILGPDVKRVARRSNQPVVPMPDVSTPPPSSN